MPAPGHERRGSLIGFALDRGSTLLGLPPNPVRRGLRGRSGERGVEGLVVYLDVET